MIMKFPPSRYNKHITKKDDEKKGWRNATLCAFSGKERAMRTLNNRCGTDAL